MSLPPAVSVVVATYNYGRFLAGALDSALSQTFLDFEVIVIDDGSTDDTAVVIAPYLDNPRVRYEHTDHLGQPGAKNTGIRLARGRYVAFLDADDLWLPTKLEKQIPLFAADPDLGVVYCRRRWIDEEGRELDRRERQPHRGDVLAPIFWRPFVCFSSTVVRRAVFDDVGLFDEEIPLAIDYDLWLRVASRYRFDYVDEPLVKYRTGHANLSRRQAERCGYVRRIIDRFLDDRGGRERLNPALVRRALADLCCDTALALRPTSRAVALTWYARSLRHRPHDYDAWRGLLTSWWPEPIKSAIRGMLGRASDNPWHTTGVVRHAHRASPVRSR